ncbi:S1 family peptidase [Candidatus Poriferisodalis sp.]|uniref:S1 family peptidase n=1 Tax=Candidatus Poriferisodalis sp. TaxID=3101277 RepID=UPI003B5B8459
MEGHVNIAPYFYKIYRVDGKGAPARYLGMSIPVAPRGGLLTARHVVDVELASDERIAVADHGMQHLCPVDAVRFSTDCTLDLAYISSNSMRGQREYLPILSPPEIRMGLDVYTFGHYLPEGSRTETRHGYFKGNVVNVSDAMPTGHVGLTLSYPILEGLSGSAILTYHNGVKIVGLAIGNAASRVLAQEHVEYVHAGDEIHVRESVHRIIELGQAHNAPSIIRFADELSLPILVTSERANV